MPISPLVEALDELLARLTPDAPPTDVKLLVLEACATLKLRPNLLPLCEALEGLANDDGHTVAKVREILAAARRVTAIEWEFGPGLDAGPLNAGQYAPVVTINIPNTQNQNQVVQLLRANWGEVEEMIDADEGVPPESKDEVKSIAKRVWDSVSSGSRDFMAIHGALIELSRLGLDAQKFLGFIGGLT